MKQPRPTVLAPRSARCGAAWRVVPAWPQRRCARSFAGSCTLAALCLGELWLPVAQAGDEPDHERARAAVRAGEVLPLPALRNQLRRTHPGQVLELELERESGRWIYEVKLLQPNGQLLKLELDAATGQVLRLKPGKGHGADRRDKASTEGPKPGAVDTPEQSPKASPR